MVCGIRVVLGWLRGGYVQHLRADAGNLCCAPKIPQRSPEIYKTCASDRKSCVNAKACLPPPEALGKALHRQNLLARLPVHLEAHEGIAPGGGGHLLHRQLVQKLSPGGGLLGFGLISGEALDEALQLLDLLLVLPVLILDHPLDQLVQSSIWPADIRKEAKKHNITLL